MLMNPAQKQNRAIGKAQPSTGLIDRSASGVRQLLCGLHGHDTLLHFEQERLSLVCTSCGYETPGWELNGVPPRSEAPAASRRMVPLQLLGQRRVA